MTAAQAAAWDELRGDIPWLESPHAGVVEIAALLQARLRSGAEMSIGALNLLRLLLGQLGASPTDAAKVAWSPPEDDPDAEIFGE
jgi:hypothetical protein